MGDVQTIKNIMEIYEKASGQKLNTEKTTLFFSKNVPNCSKLFIKNLLGVPEIREYESYLDLPAVVGKNKKASLNYRRKCSFRPYILRSFLFWSLHFYFIIFSP